MAFIQLNVSYSQDELDEIAGKIQNKFKNIRGVCVWAESSGDILKVYGLDQQLKNYVTYAGRKIEFTIYP
jgi:hypothetical protein